MLLLSLVLSCLPLVLCQYSDSKCRCFPGDACWPGPKDWAALNKTVGGKLVATVPVAAPCHDSPYAPYNATTCKLLQDYWYRPEVHYDSSSSIQTPYFANRSCDPYTGRSGQCVIGTYVQYAIDVREASDVRAGLDFATKKNIRLIVRNTGHDYSGKSTGAGALAIWTHHLKSVEVTHHSDAHYQGPAMKVGAGVQGQDVYSAADAQGLQVVSGECPSVGMAGGYTQGGGHSLYLTARGLGADQALEWEVVTGTGEYLVANRQQNTDMYWALSGGGGGTYGVVLSLKVKAYVDEPVIGYNITWNKTDPEPFYEAVATYHTDVLPALVDAGATAFSGGYSNALFEIGPVTMLKSTEAKMTKLFKPLTDKLTQLKIPYMAKVHTYAKYLDALTMFTYVGVGTYQTGTRFIPRSVIKDNTDGLIDAIRHIMEANSTNWGGVGFNIAKAADPGQNSAHPEWRDAILLGYATMQNDITASPEFLAADQRRLADDLLPPLQRLTPGGGGYMNEACFFETDWKQAFYGSNYDRLESIKNKYDPHHMFYALTAVGSDYWAPQPDGRLCRA